MTYAELVAKLQTWWESTETAFVAEADTFIEFAEKRIYRSIDLNTARKEDATVVITESQATVTIPTEVVTFHSVATLIGGVRTLLEQKDLSFIDDYAPDRTVEGVAKYYAWYDDVTVLLAPTPNAAVAAGTLALSYTYRPAQLASGNTTSWLSLNAPDLLFYSCMLEVLTFQKAEADTIADYTAKYQQALQEVLLEENMRNRTDSYRQGEIRMGL
jgi:hypothetical protein